MHPRLNLLLVSLGIGLGAAAWAEDWPQLQRDPQWKYRTLAASADDPHSGAPIMQSAASDGERVFFGAENMFFYALDARTGQEVWRKKLGGQSFMFSN